MTAAEIFTVAYVAIAMLVIGCVALVLVTWLLRTTIDLVKYIWKGDK